MKKKIAAALAATFALGVTSAFAANPFVDVPAKHWAYDSVNKLAQAGIIDGYGDGTFKGQQNMTRYEMAQIVAKAMAKSDKANAEQKAMINKLSAEFSSELNNLGVRVGELEKKVSNIKFTGELLLGYERVDSTRAGSNEFYNRQRIHMTAPVTDKITYNARLQAGSSKFGDGTSTANFTRNFVTVKDFMGVNETYLGRQPLAVGRYLAFADTEYNDGIAMKHNFGKSTVHLYHVQANVKTSTTAAVAGGGGAQDAKVTTAYDKSQVTGVNVNFAPTKSLDFNVGYFGAQSNQTISENLKFYNAGFSYAFGNGFSMVGDYVKSNADADNKAYAAQLVYNWKSGKRQMGFYGWERMVNPAVAHDQAVSFSYFNVETNSLPGYGNSNFTAFGEVKGKNTFTTDVKGYMFAYTNVFAKNVVLSTYYIDAKKVSDTSKTDKKIVAELEFLF